MMRTQEGWKPVVDYEGLYEVSDLGRVKSIPREGTKGGLLKPQPDGDGYLRVKLCKNGEKEPRKVHQLVMEAFVGKCPENHEVDHYDWNPKNNRLENLRYLPAEDNHRRKSPEWHEKMKKLHQDPEYQKKIAEANKKKAQDPEWLRKNAEAMQKLAQDPNWQKNHAEAMKKLAQDPEWLRKNAEAVRKALCKPVDQLTLDGVFIKRWPSATDAARKLGLSRENISRCCQGKRNKANGFRWRYAD